MTARKTWTAGQAVVEALKAQDVRVIFGLPGRHVFPIYDALRDSPIRHVGVLHEANAAQMADAYGRLTGRAGVCLFTGGPGATNALTAMAQAYDAASPVVQIAGAVPRGAPPETFHGVGRPDFLTRTFRDVTKWTARIESVEGVFPVMRRAFHEAQAGRPGPVFVEVPLDVFKLPPTPLPPLPDPPAQAAPPPPPRPSRQAIRDIAGGLLRARRPVVFAGKGVLRDGAAAEVASLAEALGAPVVVARDALGAIPARHPWSAGHLCFWSTDPWVKTVLRAADAVLVAGLRAESAFWKQVVAQTGTASKFLLGTDVKRRRLEGARVAENSHLGRGLGALLEAIREDGPGRSRWDEKVFQKGCQAVRRHLQNHVRRFSRRRPGRIHQGWAVNEIFRTLPEAGIFVSEVCHASYWAWKLTPAPHVASFQHSGVWSGMGFGLPAASAAKLCHPDRPVVAMVGDGGLWMSLADFPTLVRQGLPVVLVVMNDAHFGMVRQFQLEDFGRTFEDRTPVQD
ncbi:MAG: thiamine pyrophosphate-binding protein, partial [Nitrospinota bacterium]|nr:thiamine pyrophosphate-binding protein [Nitrospinota bacterium]